MYVQYIIISILRTKLKFLVLIYFLPCSTLQALHPELYLLPGIENIYSSLSSTPEKHHNNPEYVLTSASYERPHSLISPNPDIYPNSTMLDSSFKNNLSQTREKADFGEWNEKETLPVLHKKQSSEQEKNESIQGKSSSQQRKGETLEFE